MHADYYLNTIYPFQNRVLRSIVHLPVEFYLTGGTALSREYLHHRFSDDLDFFINASETFKDQVEIVLKALKGDFSDVEVVVADEDFARFILHHDGNVLKLDFVNDVPYRSGTVRETELFVRTDNVLNILSNKITALGRYSAKDVVDLVYISRNFQFNWENMIAEASEKDMWVNPVNIAGVLEEFPVSRLEEIVWVTESPDRQMFQKDLALMIVELLRGSDNTLVQVP